MRYFIDKKIGWNILYNKKDGYGYSANFKITIPILLFIELHPSNLPHPQSCRIHLHDRSKSPQDHHNHIRHTHLFVRNSLSCQTKIFRRMNILLSFHYSCLRNCLHTVSGPPPHHPCTLPSIHFRQYSSRYR